MQSHKNYLVLITLITACITPKTEVEVAHPATRYLTNTTCATIAIPDDGIDDTISIQAAINSKCCLGSGIYDVAMAETPLKGRRSYNMLTIPTGGELCGSGPGTMIRFHGDARATDWRGVEALGNNVSIHNLTLDTEDITNTVEQTHEIHVTGPVDGLLIHDVWLNHPNHAGFIGGDCIDFVGYPLSMITNTHIYNNHFLHCSREGIEIHSGVNGMMIDNNEFIDVRVIDIDTEGSGGISNLTIAHNTHLVGPSQAGGVAIALDIVTDSTIVDNVLNRGIYLYACDRCAIDHNTITLSSGLTSTAIIEVIKLSSELTIVRNTITRAIGQTDGMVIRISPHNSTPKDSRIVGNTIVQQTAGTIISTEGIVGVLVANNTIAYAGPLTYAATALYFAGSSGTDGFRTTDLVVSHNYFVGPMKWAVAISGSYLGTGSLTMIGNSADSVVKGGLSCSNLTSPGRILGPIIYSNNLTLPTPVCGIPSILNLGL